MFLVFVVCFLFNCESSDWNQVAGPYDESHKTYNRIVLTPGDPSQQHYHDYIKSSMISG